MTGDVSTEHRYAGPREGQVLRQMAALMIALNLVGFAPSYFLKSVFDAPELPLRIHIHGVLFTLWFVLFLTQTLLVANRNVVLHKRLGVAGAVLACWMVISGLTILYFRALEYHEVGGQLVVVSAVVWGNLALLLSAVIVHDVLVRGRPHPAVMWGAPLFFASIVLIGLFVPQTQFGQGLILLLG